MSHFVEISEVNGVPRITFKDTRFYECTDAPGEYVPSVTTYLECAPKPRHFYEWLKKNGEESDTLAAEAMEKGSRVHNATEILDNTGKLKIVDEQGNSPYYLDEIKMIYRYKDFLQRYTDTSATAIEQAYGSKVLMDSGTIDRVWTLKDGKRWLFDIKTGNMYEYYFMQLVAYKRLWEYFNPKMKIDHVGILHLKSNTRTEKELQGKGWKMETPEKPEEYYLDLYESTKKQWRFIHENDKPRNFTFNTEIVVRENRNVQSGG
jgi:hypothetical protein